MKCPNCTIESALDPITVAGVVVNNCKTCNGIWFDSDDLRKAKDTQVAYANWFDVDLWENTDNFHCSVNKKLCPKDGAGLYTLAYADSEVFIDVCKECQGIWLDKDEFDQIIQYVKQGADNEILQNYFSNLAKETAEVFNGTEGFRSEVSDVLMLVDMFKYKFAVQHPKLLQVIVNMPLLR